MQYSVNLNGEQYRIDSHGHGEPIVMLHGFTGTAQTWKDQVSHLSRTYEVITPDLLGHGETSAPTARERYRMERAAADLIALFNALRLEAVHLTGYSMGGRLALFTALRYPSRLKSLILESASPGLRSAEEREKRRADDERLADRLEQDGIEAFVDYWESLPMWDSQKQTLSSHAKQAIRTERLSHQPHGLANSLREMGTGAQPSLWEELSDLNIPIQLIVGELDGKFATINREMATLLPHARLMLVSNCGHAVHLERPSEFGEIVQTFLS